MPRLLESRIRRKKERKEEKRDFFFSRIKCQIGVWNVEYWLNVEGLISTCAGWSLLLLWLSSSHWYLFTDMQRWSKLSTDFVWLHGFVYLHCPYPASHRSLPTAHTNYSISDSSTSFFEVFGLCLFPTLLFPFSIPPTYHSGLVSMLAISFLSKEPYDDH